MNYSWGPSFHINRYSGIKHHVLYFTVLSAAVWISSTTREAPVRKFQIRQLEV